MFTNDNIIDLTYSSDEDNVNVIKPTINDKHKQLPEHVKQFLLGRADQKDGHFYETDNNNSNNNNNNNNNNRYDGYESIEDEIDLSTRYCNNLIKPIISDKLTPEHVEKFLLGRTDQGDKHFYKTNNNNNDNNNNNSSRYDVCYESIEDEIDSSSTHYSEVNYLRMMEIKGLVISLNKYDCFKFHQATLDQFQSFPIYDRFIHDCSEKALFYLVDSKPNMKIWPEKFQNNQIYQNVHIPPYLNEFPLNHSDLKNKKNKICNILFHRKSPIGIYTKTSVPSYYLCKPRQYNQSSSSNNNSNNSNSNISNNNSDMEGTMRLQQSMECSIRLPISGYKPPKAPSHIKWCEVNSLEELDDRVRLAKKLGRMLIIVCSKQNRNLWEPKGFELWAHQYPRLMFASIDRDVANDHYNRQLRIQLLGFSYIDGLAFVSHVPGEELCRAFNANNIQTEDIFTSLKLRYEVASQTKVISALEHNGISSLLEVNLKNALYYCYKQFTIAPLSQEFSFQLEDYEEGIEIDQSVVEVPTSGFTVQRCYKNPLTTTTTSSNDSNSGINKENITNISNLSSSTTNNNKIDNKDIHMIQSNCYPLGFQLPLLIEQIKSVEWMLQRESIDTEVLGISVHRAHIPIPPIENLSIKWLLQGKFTLSGGILADEMGFGKTSCILALITSTQKIANNLLNKNLKINKNNIDNFIRKKSKKTKNNELYTDEQKLKVMKLSESESSSILPSLEAIQTSSIHESSSSYHVDNMNISNDRYNKVILNCPKELIPTNATLIIVPSHLLYQWENEIKKFILANYLKCITIANVNEIPTVSDIQKADIILVSIRLFESSVYHEKYLGCNFNKLKVINNKNNKSKNNDNNNINPTNTTQQQHIDELYLNALHKLPLPSITSTINKKLTYPLELYYWKRIVIDEIHELVAADGSLSSSQVIDVNIINTNHNNNMDNNISKIISNPTTNNKSIWTFPIKCLSSKFKWGLTGTPPLFNLEEINSLGSFLGVHIGICDSSLAKNFVDTFISSNYRQVCTYPTPIEKYVYLQLSIEEMALYAQKRFDLQSKLQKHAGVTVAEQNKAYEDILQHCSYFLSSYTTTTNNNNSSSLTSIGKITSNSNSNSKYFTAENEIEKQFELKNKNLNRLHDKLIDLKQQYENCKQSIRLLDQDDTMREDLRRNKLSNLQGRKEELLDKVKSMQNQHDEVHRSIQFFNSSIEQLRTKSKLPECPICLEDMVWGDATITTCGHLQCSQCVQKLFTLPAMQPNNTNNNNSATNNNTSNSNSSMQKTGLCATCRCSITMNDWSIIEKESYQQLHLANTSSDDNNETIDNNNIQCDHISNIQTNNKLNDSINMNTSIPVIKKPDKKYLAFGTKIAYIVSQIELILQVDPTAKLLIYCQWDSLKSKIMDAFNKLQLSYVCLEGRPETLRGILERFQSNGLSSNTNTTLLTTTTSTINPTNIMLCSLELKAAGLNLQVANHIIFVHPFFSCNNKVTTAWEAQAIGRVLRPGQIKQVNIWRFIALDTIEQEILVKRNINEWKMHFS